MSFYLMINRLILLPLRGSLALAVIAMVYWFRWISQSDIREVKIVTMAIY